MKFQKKTRVAGRTATLHEDELKLYPKGKKMSTLKKIKAGDSLLRFGMNGSSWRIDTPAFYSVHDDKVCFISESDGMCRASTREEYERMNLRDKPSFDAIEKKNPIIVSGSYNVVKGTAYEKGGKLHLFIDPSTDIVWLKS